MKIRNRLLVIILLPAMYFSFYSCEKNAGPPEVSLAKGEGFVSSDTMLMVGDSIDVAIDVAWNGVNNLKKLEVAINQDIVSSTDISLDHAQFQITIVKGLADIETWTFTVYDEKNNQSAIDLILTKDPNSIYGPVNYYSSIRLGAQENFNLPGFYAIESAGLYDLDAAFINQADIDILFYYNEADKSCIASPGANIEAGVFSGDIRPASWTIRNTTRFVETEMTAADFDGIFHDGIFLTKYDTASSKRKAKGLEPGDVYLFKTETGLFGAFYVSQIDSGSDGEIEIAVKVQAK